MLMKMRSKMQRTNNQKGFTLVELMVVVVIIGILVAIAVPVYRNIQNNAAENACAANIRTIEGVLEVYKADTNTTTYPADLNTLVPAYIKAIPTCPTNASDGSSVAYTYNSTNGTVTCPNHP